MFQRVPTEVLKGIDEATGYIDDIIVTAKTSEVFVKKGKEVLGRLNQCNIRLRMKKFENFRGQEKRTSSAADQKAFAKKQKWLANAMLPSIVGTSRVNSGKSHAYHNRRRKHLEVL